MTSPVPISLGKCLARLGVMLLALTASPLYAGDDEAAIVVAQAASSADGAAEPKRSAESRASGLKYPAGRWHFQTTIVTRHFNPSPEHTNTQRMLNFQYWDPNRWLWGAAFLRNSFNQPTQYVYMGRIWRPLDSVPVLHLKLTGGVLHGYKGEYRDKIPFNHYGYAPALVPSIGLSGKRFSTDLVLLGSAAVFASAGIFWD